MQIRSRVYKVTMSASLIHTVWLVNVVFYLFYLWIRNVKVMRTTFFSLTLKSLKWNEMDWSMTVHCIPFFKCRTILCVLPHTERYIVQWRNCSTGPQSTNQKDTSTNHKIKHEVPFCQICYCYAVTWCFFPNCIKSVLNPVQT